MDICEDDSEMKDEIKKIKFELTTKCRKETSRRLKRTHSNNARSQSVRRTSIRDKSQIHKREVIEEGILLTAQEHGGHCSIGIPTPSPSTGLVSPTTSSLLSTCSSGSTHTQDLFNNVKPYGSDDCSGSSHCTSTVSTTHSYTKTRISSDERTNDDDDVNVRDYGEDSSIQVVVLKEDEEYGLREEDEEQVKCQEVLLLPHLKPSCISRISLREQVTAPEEANDRGLNDEREQEKGTCDDDNIDHYYPVEDERQSRDGCLRRQNHVTLHYHHHNRQVCLFDTTRDDATRYSMERSDGGSKSVITTLANGHDFPTTSTYNEEPTPVSDENSSQNSKQNAKAFLSFVISSLNCWKRRRGAYQVSQRNVDS